MRATQIPIGARWVEEIRRCGLDTSHRRVWQVPVDLPQIATVVAAFSAAHGHWFMPDGGGHDVVAVTQDGAALQLDVSYREFGGLTLRVTPRELRFEYIAAAPVDSFFRLILDPRQDGTAMTFRQSLGGRIIKHVFTGSLLLASKAGKWNQIPVAYDALHLTVSDTQIRDIFDRALRKRRE